MQFPSTQYNALFQSTLSVRRATCATHTPQCSRTFQSTLSVRRATGVDAGEAHGVKISIHALREESDPDQWRVAAQAAISIHALREESDSAQGNTATPVVNT